MRKIIHISRISYLIFNFVFCFKSYFEPKDKIAAQILKMGNENLRNLPAGRQVRKKEKSQALISQFPFPIIK